MPRVTQALKVSQPLHAILHYVGVAKGKPGARQVGEDILVRTIQEHPVGARMLALVDGNLGRQRGEESKDE